MDTAQWPQEIVTYTCPKPQGNDLDKKARPQKEQAQNCPRCNSTNTKFCYYNNYSLTQPRFFCKACRRYWTKGGSLRSIPVGGGSRKNKRPLINSLNSNSSSKKLCLDDHHQNPRNPDGQDLNLGFPSSSSSQPLKSFSDMIQSQNQITSPNASTSPSQQLSALELLTGFSSRGLGNGFMPMPVHHQDPNSGYGHGLGFPLHDFKPTLSFSMDGLGSGYGSLQESVNGRLLFPFEDIKPQQQLQVSSTGDDEHQKESNTNGDSTGYWTGMLGGGGSW